MSGGHAERRGGGVEGNGGVEGRDTSNRPPPLRSACPEGWRPVAGVATFSGPVRYDSSSLCGPWWTKTAVPARDEILRERIVHLGRHNSGRQEAASRTAAACSYSGGG
ncbi:hypothetical protein MRX96_036529 [Rhipicephalus microplus]